VPATPLEAEFAGAVFEKTKLAEIVDKAAVLTDGLPAGSRRTKILSVLAVLAAIGSSDTFLLLSAI
jgi:hypothetical protein